MKNRKKILARVFLILSIFSVLLTVVIPIKCIEIGMLISDYYKGIYAVGLFSIFLGSYFVISKGMKEDFWVNRLKFFLSCAFLISLFTNVFFQ